MFGAGNSAPRVTDKEGLVRQVVVWRMNKVERMHTLKSEGQRCQARHGQKRNGRGKEDSERGWWCGRQHIWRQFSRNSGISSASKDNGNLSIIIYHSPDETCRIRKWLSERLGGSNKTITVSGKVKNWNSLEFAVVVAIHLRRSASGQDAGTKRPNAQERRRNERKDVMPFRAW